MSDTHHRVVVIGGGNAGPSVAGRLRRYGVDDIVLIEPRELHFYKPLFSHITGGRARASEAVRRQADVMPRGVGLVRDAVTEIDPETSVLTLASGDRMSFDHAIVCPGIQNNWNAIPGLTEAMASPAGGSNYEYDLAAKTSLLLRDFRRGTVIFTQPAGAGSCIAASQKPMYLACDYWRATGVLDDIRVIMLVPDATVFGIPEIDRELERKIAEYGIELRTQTQVLAVDAAAQTITIGRPGGDTERLSYDLLHAVPPQSAPDWVRATTLPAPGDPGGFIEVDPRTLRHSRYPNVWALGDAAATTNSKSGGALRKQTLTVAKNLVAVLSGEEPTTFYTGYSVCPFTVSRHTVVFTEFDDHYQLKPSIPIWRTLYRERRLTWIADRYILPWVYWNMILKGRA